MACTAEPAILCGMKLRPGLLAIAACLGLALSCFADPVPSDTGSGETGETCPEGSAGCPCYPNSTCDAELECMNGTCFDPGCDEGTEDCPCYPNGTCNEGLECTDDNSCKLLSHDRVGSQVVVTIVMVGRR